MRYWTPEDDARLIMEWRCGYTLSEIGERMAVGKSPIIGRSHRLGLPTRPRPRYVNNPDPVWTPHQVEKAMALRAAGATDADIGLEFHTDPETVAIRLADVTVSTPRAKRTPKASKPSPKPKRTLGWAGQPSTARINRLPAKAFPVDHDPIPNPTTRQCQCVVTAVRPWLFCGAPVVPGRSWCPTHTARFVRVVEVVR